MPARFPFPVTERGRRSADESCWTEYSVDDSRMLPMKSSASSAVLTIVLSNSFVAMSTRAYGSCTLRSIGKSL